VSVPPRDPVSAPGDSTYFVTANTWEKRALFLAEPFAELLIDTLFSYRDKGDYKLHAFVVMPDHLHALISPRVTLEKAMQLIKGGYSYRVKKELRAGTEIWQREYGDHRIRDASDYRLHEGYIHRNPMNRGLVVTPEEYRWSAGGRFEFDETPEYFRG